MKAFFRELVITAVLALVVFFALRFTIDTVIIIGISMEPSFHSEQRILISKVAYRIHEPERGDVIVFRPTTSSGQPTARRENSSNASSPCPMTRWRLKTTRSM